MNFDGILEGIKNLFQPQQQKIISPLPAGQTLSAGLAYGMKNDQAREQAAAQTPQVPQQPFSVTDEADRMMKGRQNAISVIRQNRPEYKGTDQDIARLYDKHGEGLLSEIYQNLNKATNTPQIANGDVLGAVATANGNVPTPTPAPSGDLWGQFIEATRQAATEKGYNPDVIIKQKALESNFGRSKFAQERNNFGGIGAYDSDPNQAFSFDNIQDYLDYYFNLVQERYPDAYANRQNPQKYAEGLKAGGYATDPDYVWKIMNTPMQPR